MALQIKQTDMADRGLWERECKLQNWSLSVHFPVIVSFLYPHSPLCFHSVESPHALSLLTSSQRNERLWMTPAGPVLLCE